MRSAPFFLLVRGWLSTQGKNHALPIPSVRSGNVRARRIAPPLITVILLAFSILLSPSNVRGDMFSDRYLCAAAQSRVRRVAPQTGYGARPQFLSGVRRDAHAWERFPHPFHW
jgi:hypothetical protein